MGRKRLKKLLEQWLDFSENVNKYIKESGYDEKDEFLKTLKAKLSILKEEEQDDIISEYEAHIDLAIKMENKKKR